MGSLSRNRDGVEEALLTSSPLSGYWIRCDGMLAMLAAMHVSIGAHMLRTRLGLDGLHTVITVYHRGSIMGFFVAFCVF